MPRRTPAHTAISGSRAASVLRPILVALLLAVAAVFVPRVACAHEAPAAPDPQQLALFEAPGHFVEPFFAPLTAPSNLAV